MGAELFVSVQHCPDDPGVFVGHGDDSAVHTASFAKAVDPLTEGVRLSLCYTDYRSGTMDQKGSEMSVSTFADPHE